MFLANISMSDTSPQLSDGLVLNQKPKRKMKMAKRTPDQASGIERGPGERSTGGKSTFIGQDAGTINVGYSQNNVQLVDIGNPNAYESKRTPLDQLHVP